MRQIRKGGPSRPPSLRKNINMDIFVYFFKLYSLWFSNFQVSFKQFVKYNALVINIHMAQLLPTFDSISHQRF
jgi:hypothetical protein